jgi:hypothetical protein
LKEVVSSQEIRKSYWNSFQYEEENKTLSTSTRKQVSSWVKKRLDNEFVMLRDSYNSAA